MPCMFVTSWVSHAEMSALKLVLPLNNSAMSVTNLTSHVLIGDPVPHCGSVASISPQFATVSLSFAESAGVQAATADNARVRINAAICRRGTPFEVELSRRVRTHRSKTRRERRLAVSRRGETAAAATAGLSPPLKFAASSPKIR